MKASPLASCERVRHVLDDQVRHPGRQAAMRRLSVSWPVLALIAQPLRLDGSPHVGDPIDALAHLLESLHFGDGALLLLRPECERGPAALGRSRSWPAARRVCPWLSPPTH